MFGWWVVGASPVVLLAAITGTRPTTPDPRKGVGVKFGVVLGVIPAVLTIVS